MVLWNSADSIKHREKSQQMCDRMATAKMERHHRMDGTSSSIDCLNTEDEMLVEHTDGHSS